MGIHILMMVVTSCRPGEHLQSMREDLIRPMHGVTSDWSLLLHPVQRGVPSKTQSYDDTTELKNQIYPWITKVAGVLAAGRPSEKIFEYRYEDFTKEFRIATRAPGLKIIVPYQCRHSGAPLDEVGQHRTIEKSGRLAQIQSDLSKSQLTYFEATAFALEELIFGRHRAEDVLRHSDDGRLFLNLFSNDRVVRAAQRLGVRAAF